jgi:hypothetical protein
MITSSINEFSNPAYNGVSALDEETKRIEDDNTFGQGTVNGDYTDTNLSLGSNSVETNVVGLNGSNIENREGEGENKMDMEVDMSNNNTSSAMEGIEAEKDQTGMELDQV